MWVHKHVKQQNTYSVYNDVNNCSYYRSLTYNIINYEHFCMTKMAMSNLNISAKEQFSLLNSEREVLRVFKQSILGYTNIKWSTSTSGTECNIIWSSSVISCQCKNVV